MRAQQVEPIAVQPIADIAKPRTRVNARAANWAAAAVLVASVPLTLAWIGLLGWLVIHLIRVMV